MIEVKTQKQYEALKERVDELLLLVNGKTHKNDKNMIELDFLVSLIDDYEEKHFHIEMPQSLLSESELSDGINFLNLKTNNSEYSVI